jgi:hypothetical protein
MHRHAKGVPPLPIASELDKCPICLRAKLRKANRGTADSRRATVCNQGISVDFGFMVQTSDLSRFKRLVGLNGETCYCLITDHHSGTLYGETFRSKAPPIEFLQRWLATHAPPAAAIKYVRLDLGGELGRCPDVSFVRVKRLPCRNDCCRFFPPTRPRRASSPDYCECCPCNARRRRPTRQILAVLLPALLAVVQLDSARRQARVSVRDLLWQEARSLPPTRLRLSRLRPSYGERPTRQAPDQRAYWDLPWLDKPSNARLLGALKNPSSPDLFDVNFDFPDLDCVLTPFSALHTVTVPFQPASPHPLGVELLTCERMMRVYASKIHRPAVGRSSSLPTLVHRLLSWATTPRSNPVARRATPLHVPTFIKNQDHVWHCSTIQASSLPSTDGTTNGAPDRASY